MVQTLASINLENDDTNAQVIIEPQAISLMIFQKLFEIDTLTVIKFVFTMNHHNV